MYSKLFSVIGIYQPTISISNQTFDAKSSGYLHLHILDNQLTQDCHFSECHGKAGILYQWGDITQKITKTRRDLVSIRDCLYFGQIGLGSLAKGSELKGNFTGGGEGFIYGDKSYRIIKGNQAIKLEEDDKFWIAQTTAFKNKMVFNSLTTVENRQDLAVMILNLIGGNDQIFVTCFNARFDLKHLYCRSNGIFATDSVNAPDKGVFFGPDIQGGHLIGDSDNEGDKAHIECNFAKVKLKIEGPLLVEPIDEIHQVI